MNALDSVFINEPDADFSDLDQIDAMKAALDAARAQSGQKYSLVIGGEKIGSTNAVISTNPANFSEVVGEVAAANSELAGRAVASAALAFKAWRKTPIEERVEFLKTVAANLRARRFEFAAWIVLEVSKNWNDANAEVARAIDFCEYYAREMQRLSTPPALPQLAGERVEYSYRPLGAGVVIAPWNEPLAALCNLTLAPVVTGNTVVMKPSQLAPVVAARFFNLLEESGLPAGVVNFLVDRDDEIMDELAIYSRASFVAFTGSQVTGIPLQERIAKVPPGENQSKRAILEMGAKGTIIVDETADLDLAADHIAVSAFSFQGQKSSSCGRVVALTAIHDKLLQKLVERVNRLLVRDPSSPNIPLGAVIDEAAYTNICSYFSAAKTEALLAVGGIAKKNTGYFVWPTIYTGVRPDSMRLTDEEVGPILTMRKVRDWDEALRFANNSDSGLTGAVFSQNEERIEQAREEFEVGNLFINRKTTDSAVGAHPHGGVKLSGNAFKSGGPNYLLNFLREKTVVRGGE